MLISLQWLNSLVTPGDATPEEIERALTYAGFPIESAEKLPDGDVRLDVEITSNRGDCLSHVGLARELAAATGRQLNVPSPSIKTGGGNVKDAAGLKNDAGDGCPRFTARVVKGVKVGPSPKWLVRALEAVGQRSINNVVDVTNYVLFERGHPSHVFDLSALAGKRLVVRSARDGEKIQTLDGRTHTLKAGEIVVADAERPQGIAGVMGGEDSSVTEKTTDVLIECATWDPAAVRRVARRLQIRTDASHRYERYVDPRTTDDAAARVAELIQQLAGGTILDGMLDEGAPLEPRKRVRMRTARCNAIIGEPVPTGEMARLLTALEIDAHVDRAGEEIECEIPAFRPDLLREIDLIEEVARTHGYERIGVDPKMSVEITHPQESERALRVIGETMAAMGYFETVTFSFVTRETAEMFLPAGMRTLAVDEARRPGAPALRPSVLSTLLECRRVNQDARVAPEGGVRLFEIGPGFQEDAKGRTAEFRALAMIVDAPDAQRGLREVRGAVEAVAARLGGASAKIDIEACPPFDRADKDGATATVAINGTKCGAIRLVSEEALKKYDLATPVAAAEIELGALLALWPPRSRAAAPPAFPAIERDLSLVVDEHVAWSTIAAQVRSAKPALLDGVEFVGVYRGKQVGEGRKSLTLRMRFRDDSRTLRHEEVDPQVASVVAALEKGVGASIRR